MLDEDVEEVDEQVEEKKNCPCLQTMRLLCVYVEKQLRDLLGKVCAETSGGCQSSPMTVGELLSKWRTRWGVHLGSCVAWPVAGLLAAAMVNGKWTRDVSVKHRRRLGGRKSCAYRTVGWLSALSGGRQSQTSAAVTCCSRGFRSGRVGPSKGICEGVPPLANYACSSCRVAVAE